MERLRRIAFDRNIVTADDGIVALPREPGLLPGGNYIGHKAPADVTRTLMITIAFEGLGNGNMLLWPSFRIGPFDILEVG